MKRTEILCPNCMKKKLLDIMDKQDDKPILRCDECGTEFIQQGPMSVTYK